MSTTLDPTANIAAIVLMLGVVVALLALVAVAVRSPYMLHIAARNTRRRAQRTVLVVFGLMLATTFIAGALMLDDTISLAVKQVAVYSLGRVDEEVVSAHGGLGLYPASATTLIRGALAGNKQVAGIAPALAVPDLLIVDEDTQQVRGNVLGVGLDPGNAGPLTAFTDARGAPATPLADLAANTLYLNRAAARLLDARSGDILDLYSSYAPGHRLRFVLGGVVSGGALSQLPSALARLDTMQALLASPGQINRIFIANAGDGLSGVVYSDAIAAVVNTYAPTGLTTYKVKQEGVNYALHAEELFNRILTLYTLFALAIGLLLIFLIFALLAAERRVELGTARALGLHRTQVAQLLLLEGAAYAVPASLLGTIAGAGLGALIIQLVAPTVARFGLPLRVDLQLSSLITAFCLGLLFTLLTIVVAVASLSRLSVAAALRGLPEPPKLARPLGALLRASRAWPLNRWRQPLVVLAAWGHLALGLVTRGLLPLAASVVVVAAAVASRGALALECGISGVLVSLVLLARWMVLAAGQRLFAQRKPVDALRGGFRLQRQADRFSALLIGAGLAVQWSLPFDTLQRFGLPRLSGGVDLFFIAGVMMVAGAVLAIAPNLDLLLLPLRALARHARPLRSMPYVALVYPSQQRLRSGLTIAMFSLVTFTMVVMACIAASTTQRYGNFSAQAGGYDIIGQPLFKPAGDLTRVSSAIAASDPAAARDLTASALATPLPLIMLQPNAAEPRWAVYPAAAISGAFLHGAGLPLAARAPQFANDAAVWDAVRAQPGDVVIDAGALSDADLAVLGLTPPARVGVEDFVAPPIASGLLGLASLESLLGQSAALAAQNAVPHDVRQIISDPNALSSYAARLSAVATDPGQIAPTPLWIADPRGGPPISVTVVGIVANAHSQSYGLLGSAATFDPIEHDQTPIAGQFYFFKLRAGAPVRQDALAIGSALLDDGFQTTVIADALVDQNAPQVFASRVLIGLVGLALLVGMIALAVTGTRAVVERRQQIGVLRALGFSRRAAGGLFVIEALVVAVTGAAIGLVLGLTLARNLVAVSFFAQVPAGLPLIVPWPALGGIGLIALLVAALAALEPAAQASRVAPADALRYE
ncbi:MAG: ABC transporter permease [Ktedonobacterales bacterium]